MSLLQKLVRLSVILVTIILSACQFRQAVLLPHTQPKAQIPIRDTYVFLINLDGSRPQEIERWVRAGHLPNIENLFFKQGAIFEHAINSFPTVSTPNHQGFISGLFPGHHGIPALDWYSRPLKKHIDYLKIKDMTYNNVLMFNFLQLLNNRVISDAPQLLFADLYGHPTLSVLEPSNFGMTHYLPKRPPAKGALDFYYRQTYETMDWAVLKNLMDYLENANEDKFPRFSFINFCGMDNLGHFDGPDSERALDFYIHYDRALANLVDLLKRKKVWDKTTLILVSDHGQHYIKETIDLKAMLKRIGFPLKNQSSEKKIIVWGDHGTGTSNLHLRMGPSWEKIPTYSELRNFPMPDGKRLDLVAAFLQEPSIEMVFLKEGPQTTHVFVKDQHARILQKWENGRMFYRYLPDSGQDPLNYLKNTQIKNWVEAGTYQDTEQWLEATAHLQRPDAVVAIAQLFDDGRTGDLIIQTYPDKQFKEVKLSAHGSLEREDRQVNLMFHGPDIVPGRYSYARIVDVYPTLLTLFGLENTMPMDGKLRSEILTQEVLLSPKYKLRGQKNSLQYKTAAEFLDYIKALNSKTMTSAEKDKNKQLQFELVNFLKEKNP